MIATKRDTCRLSGVMSPLVSIEVDGAAIRARRVNKGVTITELAAGAGVSRSYVSKIERGHRARVSRPVLRQLAGALSVPQSYIRRGDSIGR
jgi:transcriptional regulator with XRE-family HTH domain